MDIIKRIFHFFDNLLIKFEVVVLSWAIIVISVMTFGNVVYRQVTGSSWNFAQEVSEIAIIMATFFGISYAARKGRHISMSAFFDMAPKKVKKVLVILNPIITSAILFLLCYYSYLYMMTPLNQARTTSAMEIPYWVMIIPITLGLFLGGVQFLRNAWINIVNLDEVYLAQEKRDYDEQ